MLMLYYKVLDNLEDGDWKERLLAMLLMPFARRAWRSAAAHFPDAAKIIYEAISRQSEIEQTRSGNVDEAAEPTALALSGICALLSPDEGQRRTLERFGYLLGRYVYLADALDDLEEDQRRGNYNAFLLRDAVERSSAPEQLADIRENAKGSLFLTIAEIGKTYELLNLHQYKPILDNVVYMGLLATVERILQPKEASRG